MADLNVILRGGRLVAVPKDLGPQYRGEWAPGTTYNPDDLVTYGGTTYITIAPSPFVSQQPPPNPAAWQVFAAAGMVGPQGPQGDTGPNQVSTTTSTDISGILKGASGSVAQAVAGTDYVATDDARLSDARTPTAHTHAGDTLGALDKLSFDISPAGTLAAAGEMIWNANEETLDIQLNDFVQHTGQHLLYHAKNNTASTIAKGVPVMFAGTSGNSGKLLIKPWDGIGPASFFMGITGEEFLTGEEGFVVAFGKIRGIQTNGANYGESWVDGQVIYAASTAGNLTKTAPAAPNPLVEVMAVVHASANNGTIFVRPSHILSHIHSVFTGDSGSGGAAGFVPAPAAGDAAAGKYLDADGTWTVPPTGGGVSDGDKGDITVSAAGATWTIDNDAVTYAKLQNISATSRILARKTAAAGDAEECTLSEILDFIGSAAQGDILYRGASGWARLAAGTSGHYLKTLGSGANPEWAAVPTNGQLGIVIGQVGGEITTGFKGYLRVPYNCTINSVEIVANESGNIVVDIWRSTFANLPPGVGNSITGSAKPTLSSALTSQSSTLTDWTTSLSAGDYLAFNVDSATTVSRVILTLVVTRTT